MKKNFLMLMGIMLLFIATVPNASAQKHTVRGKILDETGLPLVGVGIVEKGNASNGVATDMDGNFSLTVASPQSQILITSIGYKEITLSASASEFGRPIQLEVEATQIDDLVVIGYGTVRKNDATGSVVAVRAEELNRGAVTSAQDMLQGKVPGVNILSGDGSPGSSARIRIRSGSSLNASNDPLIVIDGVPIGADASPGMANGLNTINPADIESFTVLKDASATAIYGSRASNGVIIITTKKGKGNKVQVSYNGSFSVSKIHDKLDVLDGNELRAFLPKLSNYASLSGMIGKDNVKWQNKVFQNALAHDHNVSVYGNVANKLPYRASIGYTNEEGTIKTSQFERYTASFGVSPKFFKDHLTVNINAKGVLNVNDYLNGGAIVDAAAFFDPTQSMYFTDANGDIDRTYANGYWNWLTKQPDGSYNANSLANTNPYSLIYDRRDHNNVHRFVGNAQLDYKIHGFEDLRLNLNLGMDIVKTKGDNGDKAGSFQSMKNNNTSPSGQSLKGIGQYNKYENFRRNQLLEFYANYKKEFGDHAIDVMGGYSWQHFFTANKSSDYVNGTNELYLENPLFRTENYMISFFGRVNYILMGKYLFTATVRRDGSSRFSGDNKWGWFPSAAFAWNIKNEDFLKDVVEVSSLKLRLGWGQTGQQEIGEDYAYLPRYNLSTAEGASYYMGNGYYYLLMPNAYNPNLKWESTTTYNVGVDFGFFNNFVSGSIDAYIRKTRDLLNYIPPPMGTNFSNRVIANVGKMENRGIEFSLNLNPVRTQDWNIDFGVSGTFQRSRITKLTTSDSPDYKVTMGALSTGTGGYSQVHKVGSAPHTFYLFEQVYDANGRPIQNAIVDRNGDGEITEADRYITNKNPEADFYYGINGKITYKNWDFGFNAHGSFGNWMLNDFKASHSDAQLISSQGYLRNISRYTTQLGFWGQSTIQQTYSDMYLENASFLKIDDINLGYTFQNVFSKGTSVRVAAGVQNVYTFTKYSGLDPEATPGSNGIDHVIWARPRIYSLRLNINF